MCRVNTVTTKSQDRRIIDFSFLFFLYFESWNFGISIFAKYFFLIARKPVRPGRFTGVRNLEKNFF